MNIGELNKKELSELITANKDSVSEDILNKALKCKAEHYANKIFARGLIEFTNYCKNNCYYCGIRADNRSISRYRLTDKEIIDCCKKGKKLGFSTFVLQGGEDMHFNERQMCNIIYSIKSLYPECAVTLSVGEKTREEYKSYKNAGADRYLLRHETANLCHYEKLHPEKMSLENRKRCLYILKELGFQTGAGFMVGSPYQTVEDLCEDLLFLKELQPEMVGMGPFIAHHNTPFAKFKNGSTSLCITMIALTRLLLPASLIPATTALATLEGKKGRKSAFDAGANVVMPNLTPEYCKKNYSLYDNKLSAGDESAEGLIELEKEINDAGYTLDMSRGDAVGFYK